MSRVGRMPIPVPSGVTVSIDGQDVSVKGPKGEMKQTLRPEVAVELADNVITVSRFSDHPRSRGFHGLYRQLIRNMVVGVTDGFSRVLLINGVGYRVEVNGSTVMLNLGYSNPIEFRLPEGVSAVAEGPNKLTVSGVSKELVGKVASEIRKIRPPEPYKGKGVKYETEYVRRKVGKSGIK